MNAERRRLWRAMWQLLIRRIKEEHAAYMAAASLEDLGEPDCPVCITNRHREAWA